MAVVVFVDVNDVVFVDIGDVVVVVDFGYSGALLRPHGLLRGAREHLANERRNVLMRNVLILMRFSSFALQTRRSTKEITWTHKTTVAKKGRAGGCITMTVTSQIHDDEYDNVDGLFGERQSKISTSVRL